jgi:hypothetical protein
VVDRPVTETSGGATASPLSRRLRTMGPRTRGRPRDSRLVRGSRKGRSAGFSGLRLRLLSAVPARNDQGSNGPGRPVTGASRWYGFRLDRNPRGCGASRASVRGAGNTGEGSPRDERRERRDGGARLRRCEPEARQRRENRRTDVEDEAPEDVRNVGRGKALSGGGTLGDGFGRHRRLDAPSYVARAETPGEAPRDPRVHA